MSEPLRYRYLRRDSPRWSIYTLRWDAIKHDSYVYINIAEAVVSDKVPDKFIGSARALMVGNITPHDGYVQFVPWWSADYLYLNFWVDVLVFNP